MASLSDLISNNSATQLLAQQITPGAIFHINHDQFANKPKFFVILHVNLTEVIVACIFINSEINERVIRTDNQRFLQKKISCINYPFLDKDSYINAADIKERSYSDFLINLTLAGNSHITYKCNLLEKDFDEIRSYMAISPIISNSDKKRYNLI
jgi:hypothetical protein